MIIVQSGIVAYSNPVLAAVVCWSLIAMKFAKIVIIANPKNAKGILSSVRNLVLKKKA